MEKHPEGDYLSLRNPQGVSSSDPGTVLIEDGENNILSLKSATILSEEYKHRMGL